MFAGNVLCSVKPSTRFQNELYLSFVWNRREKTHHDSVFKRSKSREKEKQRKPD